MKEGIRQSITTSYTAASFKKWACMMMTGMTGTAVTALYNRTRIFTVLYVSTV